MTKILEKYKPARLPATREEALAWATERALWAKTARESDMNGSARELELTALLLRFFADRLEGDK
jgi:hypothetical protein